MSRGGNALKRFRYHQGNIDFENKNKLACLPT